jgi:hypothetical protein
VAYKTSSSADFSGVGRFSNKVALSSPYASTGIGCCPAQLVVIDTARAKKRMNMTFLIGPTALIVCIKPIISLPKTLILI